jgi:hypothetical protein
MFVFAEWVVAGIIDGYKKGLTPFAKVTEMTANYLTKGIITQEQANQIALECPAPTSDEGDG